MKTIKQLKEELAVQRAINSLREETRRNNRTRRDLKKQINKEVHKNRLAHTIFNSSKSIAKKAVPAFKRRIVAIQRQQRKQMKSKSNPWATNF
jgi:hypothetical protein